LAIIHHHLDFLSAVYKRLSSVFFVSVYVCDDLRRLNNERSVIGAKEETDLQPLSSDIREHPGGIQEQDAPQVQLEGHDPVPVCDAE
jgi:hypothetical protein